MELPEILTPTEKGLLSELRLKRQEIERLQQRVRELEERLVDGRSPTFDPPVK